LRRVFSFAHLLIGLFVLWVLKFWVFYILWIVIPVTWISGKDFSHSVGCLFTLVIVSYTVQKHFKCIPICPFLLLFPELLEFYLKSHFLWLYPELFPLGFTVVVLKFQVFFIVQISGLKSRTLSHFKLIFIQSERQGLVLVFYIWLHSFPNTTCWRGCLFFNVCFGHLCQESWGSMTLFLGPLLHSTVLCICFGQISCCFVTRELYRIIWNLILWYLQHCSLLGIALAIWSLLCFHMNFRIEFAISVKNDIGFLMGVALSW
jgi:hypothetical protein